MHGELSLQWVSTPCSVAFTHARLTVLFCSVLFCSVLFCSREFCRHIALCCVIRSWAFARCLKKLLAAIAALHELTPRHSLTRLWCGACNSLFIVTRACLRSRATHPSCGVAETTTVCETAILFCPIERGFAHNVASTLQEQPAGIA